MGDKKRVIIIQPDAGMLARAVNVLQAAGWEVLSFDRVDAAINAMGADYDAFVLAVGPFWYDAIALLKAATMLNPRANVFGWLPEPMDKVEDQLKAAGIGVVLGSDDMAKALKEAPIREVTTPLPDAETGFSGYMLARAADGLHAPALFNALMSGGAAVWALQDPNWHMIARVQAGDQAAVQAKLDALAKTEGVDASEAFIFPNSTDKVVNALLGARRATIEAISFAFARVRLLDPDNMGVKLAMCPGVTSVSVDGKYALIQLAGVSLPILQDTLEHGVYALPQVLGVDLFAGLNILEVE